MYFFQATVQRAAHYVSDHDEDNKEPLFQKDRGGGGGGGERGGEEAFGNADMQQLIKQVTAESWEYSPILTL